MTDTGGSRAGGGSSAGQPWDGTAAWSTANVSSGARRDASYNPRLSLLDQCLAMIRYGSMLGVHLPPEAVDAVDRARLEASPSPSGAAAALPASQSGPAGAASTTPITLSELTEAHKRLAATVAPATPNTIQLLADEQVSGFWRYFGATKYARGLAGIAIALFIAFVVLQIWNSTSKAPLSLEILMTALASVIGGIFYVMFALSRQLGRGSFKRSLEGQYTNLIILGGLAGTALAFLIVQPAQADTAAGVSSTSVSVVLTRPLLALLGGFSARAVYRILERLVSTVEALVKGSGDELVAAQELAAQARAAAESLSQKAETVQKLLDINAAIGRGARMESIRAEFDGLIARLLADLPPSPPAQAD